MSAKPFWTACRGYAGSPACSLLTSDVIELSATNLARCCYDGQKPGPLENKILSCVCPGVCSQSRRNRSSSVQNLGSVSAFQYHVSVCSEADGIPVRPRADRAS